jgi:hypothetical protein
VIRALVACAALVAARPVARAGDDAPADLPEANPSVIVLRLDIGRGVIKGLGERIQLEVEYRARRAGLAAVEGEANLTDTAVVAGCTAKVPTKCLDMIIATLGVDELIYGSVDKTMGGHRVVVARARAGAKPLQAVIDVPAGSVEEAVRAAAPVLDGLFPVVTGTGPLDAGTPVVKDGGGGGDGGDKPAGAVVASSTQARATRPRTAAAIRRDRIVGMTGVAIGGAVALTGVGLWIRASMLQSDIDGAPDNTVEEVAALRDLEDRAISYATWGNRAVGVGVVVAAGGAAWWMLRGRTREKPLGGTAFAPWVAADGGGVVMTWRTP